MSSPCCLLTWRDRAHKFNHADLAFPMSSFRRIFQNFSASAFPFGVASRIKGFISVSLGATKCNCYIPPSSPPFLPRTPSFRGFCLNLNFLFLPPSQTTQLTCNTSFRPSSLIIALGEPRSGRICVSGNLQTKKKKNQPWHGSICFSLLSPVPRL